MTPQADVEFQHLVEKGSPAARLIGQLEPRWEAVERAGEAPCSREMWVLARNQIAATLLRDPEEWERSPDSAPPSHRADEDSILISLGAWNLIMSVLLMEQSEARGALASTMRNVGQHLDARLRVLRGKD